MEWSDEVIGQLKTLWSEGLSTAEIGRRLGVSKNAVVGKAHRLDLTARPSPIRRDGANAGQPPAPRRAASVTLPPLSFAELEGDVSQVVMQSAAREPLPPLEQSVSETLPVVEAVVAPSPVVAAAPAKPPRPAAPAAPPLRLRSTPRTHTRNIACSWPIGEPGTKSFRFCDATSMQGKPYCEAHAAIAYVRVKERREDAA